MMACKQIKSWSFKHFHSSMHHFISTGEYNHYDYTLWGKPNDFCANVKYNISIMEWLYSYMWRKKFNMIHLWVKNYIFMCIFKVNLYDIHNIRRISTILQQQNTSSLVSSSSSSFFGSTTLTCFSEDLAATLLATTFGAALPEYCLPVSSRKVLNFQIKFNCQKIETQRNHPPFSGMFSGGKSKDSSSSSDSDSDSHSVQILKNW